MSMGERCWEIGAGSWPPLGLLGQAAEPTPRRTPAMLTERWQSIIGYTGVSTRAGLSVEDRRRQEISTLDAVLARLINGVG